jgi:hypothetical protein
VTKETPTCACCNRRTCNRCHQTIDDTEHVCSDEDVATVLELRRVSTKQCPECSVDISNINGCDQVFCASCNTAFSWKTYERVNGPVHNPHYFEVAERFGNIPPTSRPERGDVFPHIFQIRRAISEMAQSTQSTDIEKTYRNALHIRDVECPNLRLRGATAYSFQTNLRQRVDWMRHKTTDDQFRQRLRRSDDMARYDTELLSLFEMYSDVIGGLFQNITAQRTLAAYADIIRLNEYTLSTLQSIQSRHGSTCHMYDKYLKS